MMFVGAIALLGSLLAGCQSSVLVENAKKAPVTLSTTAPMVAPPRAVAHAEQMLAETPLEDPAGHAAALAKLDELPPDTTDPAKLSEFYYQRGVTARQLGLTPRAIRDLGQALAYARLARAPVYRILAELASAHHVGGSVARAVQFYRERIEAVPPSDRGWLFRLYHGLAFRLIRMGDLKAAEAVVKDFELLEFESRRWRLRTPSLRASWHAGLENLHAYLAETRGDLARAEALYRKAFRELERANVVSYHRDLYQARIARVLAAQGRMPEAEREARAALISTLGRQGRYSAETADLIHQAIGPISAQGRFAEAEQLARAGLEILERIGVSPASMYAAGMRQSLGGALENQGRSREALEHFEAIPVNLAHEPEMFEKHFAGSIAWAHALIRAGRPREAIAFVQTALTRNRAELGERHPTTASVLGTLAVAHKRTGELGRALGEFKDAGSVLFTGALRPVAGVEFGRASQHRWLLRIASEYIDLLGEIHGTPMERTAGVDAVGEAFRLADIARGQAVQMALTAAAARAGARDPRLADLVRQEQDARQRLAALEVVLTNQLAAPRELQNADWIAGVRRDLETLRRATETLREQIARDFPDYAQLVSPTPATVDRARAVLRPGEVLISIYIGAERTLIWALPPTGLVAFAVVPVKRDELCARVNSLRRALDPVAKTLVDIPAFDVRTAYAIYETLLEPVRAGWENANTLLVVPDQCLAYLPFALLPTTPVEPGSETGALFSRYRTVSWLVRTHAVVSLPSVTSLVALRGVPAGGPTRRPFAGFGDPYFSRGQVAVAQKPSAPAMVAGLAGRDTSVALRLSPPPPPREAVLGDVLTRRAPTFDATQLGRLPRLPETAEEIRAIGRATQADPARDVFLGEQANENRVKTLNLTSYRVIAFATHGLVPGDLEGLTQPALALTAPDVAGIDGDGLLTMEEILALRLDADWVVLSACNTAAGDGAGAEAVSGLGRAFFYAGARALLVSNWSVETESARALTTDLFRRQQADPGLTRARALQRTLNALIDGGGSTDAKSGKLLFSYAHPIFWAPFTLVGDGG